jgi:hypothetical protein
MISAIANTRGDLYGEASIKGGLDNPLDPDDEMREGQQEVGNLFITSGVKSNKDYDMQMNFMNI